MFQLGRYKVPKENSNFEVDLTKILKVTNCFFYKVSTNIFKFSFMCLGVIYFQSCSTKDNSINSVLNKEVVTRTEAILGLNCNSNLVKGERKETRIWIFTGRSNHCQLLILPYNGRYRNFRYNSSLGIEHGRNNFVIDSIRLESAIIDSNIWYQFQSLLADTSSLIKSENIKGIFPWNCVIEIFNGGQYQTLSIQYKAYHNDYYPNKSQQNLFYFLKNQFNCPDDNFLKLYSPVECE